MGKALCGVPVQKKKDIVPSLGDLVVQLGETRTNCSARREVLSVRATAYRVTEKEAVSTPWGQGKASTEQVTFELDPER